MNELDELIAAGESIVEKTKKNRLNTSISSQSRESTSLSSKPTSSVNTVIDLACHDDNFAQTMLNDQHSLSNESSFSYFRNNTSSDDILTKNEIKNVFESNSITLSNG